LAVPEAVTKNAENYGKGRTSAKWEAQRIASRHVHPRWHMFEEKREAVMAIEAAVLPLMPTVKALAA
jgi:hypothetical protein